MRDLLITRYSEGYMKLRTDLPVDQAKRQLILDHLNKHGEAEVGELSELLGENRRTTGMRLQRMTIAQEVTRREGRIGRVWGYYYTARVTEAAVEIPQLDWATDWARRKANEKQAATRKSKPGHFVNDIDTRGPISNQGGQGALIERRRSVGEIV